jgi:hypothetical protein
MTSLLSRMSLNGYLTLLAMGIAGACYGVWGAERGSAAAIGGALSVVNMLSLRWMVNRMMAATDRQRAGLSLLLVAKMGALIAVVVLLINHLSVEPIGLMLGLSVLFVGPVLGGLMADPSSASDPSPAGAAGEEH